MKKKISPYLILVIGYFILILIGTILLLLPISTKEGNRLSLIDSFFLSTSAVCITGLSPVLSITNTLTLFGKIILMLLVEIGGLGFITVATFFISLLGTKIGYGDRLLIKESMNQNNLQGMVKLVRVTIFIAFFVQLIGAIIFFIIFIQDFSFWKSFEFSIFHAISAFNNNGFDLLPVGYTNQLFESSVAYLLNTSFLIIIGGIGFIVLYDIFKHKHWSKFSIHTKIVLKTSLFLIVISVLLFKLVEKDNMTWLQAFFIGVSSRTASAFSVDLNAWKNTTLLIIMILMFIGASPASTGGGIKTTTFYTIIKSVVSFSRGKETLSHRRKISDNSIIKAYVLTTVALFVIILAVILISMIEFNNPELSHDREFFFKVVFEVVSGFGTVGNSLGITPLLSPTSKLLLSAMMFFGRVGPITIISLWNHHWNLSKDSRVKYLEEKIIIG